MRAVWREWHENGYNRLACAEDRPKQAKRNDIMRHLAITGSGREGTQYQGLPSDVQKLYSMARRNGGKNPTNCT
jgi:hypothetical protein